MKPSHIIGVICLVAVVYAIGSAGITGAGSAHRDPTVEARKKVSLKKLKIIMDQNRAEKVDDDTYRVPILFRGGVRSRSSAHFEYIDIKWYFAYGREKDQGVFTLYDVGPKDTISLSSEEISSLELPGFSGGVFQFELSVAEAAYAEAASEEK